MEKATVISGPHKSQVEVPQHAWTEPLSLSSPSYLFSSYVSLLSKNPKLTIEQHIWQHKVQVIAGQMQEWLAKKASHCRNVELLNEAIESRQVGKVQDLLGILQDKLSNEEAAKLVDSAIASNQDEIVDALVASNKIDVNSLIYRKSESMLHHAIRHSPDIAKALANNLQIDINSITEGRRTGYPVGSTALHCIIHEAKRAHNANDQGKVEKLVEVAKILISREIQVNVKDSQGNTPLILAIEYNNMPLFEALFTHPKLDVNPCTNRRSPLHSAIEKKNMPAFNLLLTHQNINVNAIARSQNAPLHVAVDRDNTEMVKALVNDNRVEIDARDYFSCTPLHYVKSPEVLRLLLDNGADIHLPDDKGLSFAKKCERDQEFQDQKVWLAEYQQQSLKASGYDAFALPEVSEPEPLGHIGDCTNLEGD